MSKPKSELFSGTNGTKNNNSSTDLKNNSAGNITGDINKPHHIFQQDKHKIKEFLKTFNNNEEAAYNRLREEYNNYISGNGIRSGLLKIKININGFDITIVGNVIDGVGHIGTAYIEDN